MRKLDKWKRNPEMIRYWFDDLGYQGKRMDQVEHSNKAFVIALGVAAGMVVFVLLKFVL